MYFTHTVYVFSMILWINSSYANSINQLVFVMEIQCVSCEVGTEFVMLFRWISSFRRFHCSSVCRSLRLIVMKYQRLLYMRAAVPVERNSVCETVAHAILKCVSVHVTHLADFARMLQGNSSFTKLRWAQWSSLHHSSHNFAGQGYSVSGS